MLMCCVGCFVIVSMMCWINGLCDMCSVILMMIGIVMIECVLFGGV